MQNQSLHKEPGRQAGSQEGSTVNQQRHIDKCTTIADIEERECICFVVAVFFLCVHVVIVAGASINIVVVCTLTSGVQFGT